MRIQFEIKEKLHDIISEILHSDKWHTMVKEDKEDLKRIILKDRHFESEASVEIWKNEIHLKTAWSNYTYRIYQHVGSVWCEYVGAYRGLLEQSLLPRITPKENLLDAEVSHSTILKSERDTLRNYSHENLKQKKNRREHLKREGGDSKDHPQVVHDEFIKIGVPLPPP